MTLWAVNNMLPPVSIPMQPFKMIYSRHKTRRQRANRTSLCLRLCVLSLELIQGSLDCHRKKQDGWLEEDVSKRPTTYTRGGRKSIRLGGTACWLASQAWELLQQISNKFLLTKPTNSNLSQKRDIPWIKQHKDYHGRQICPVFNRTVPYQGYLSGEKIKVIPDMHLLNCYLDILCHPSWCPEFLVGNLASI